MAERHYRYGATRPDPDQEDFSWVAALPVGVQHKVRGLVRERDEALRKNTQLKQKHTKTLDNRDVALAQAQADAESERARAEAMAAHLQMVLDNTQEQIRAITGAQKVTALRQMVMVLDYALTPDPEPQADGKAAA